MIILKRLLTLQVFFACASLTYLVARFIRRETTGEALSAAAIGPSIAMFIAYLCILLLPKVDRVGWYRICMIPALVFFGGGGVIVKVTRFADTGLKVLAPMSPPTSTRWAATSRRSTLAFAPLSMAISSTKKSRR
ncbi:hypothetical protein [Meridianimarinicoccus aquatilis]|uniref:hypothetical protein n=1 Tax=Meridianimarinicoccus aquatilis TaxID=2552766 RepID=UPI0014049995|nr:hypothetical protein [Fluviibacterium aquatile]